MSESSTTSVGSPVCGVVGLGAMGMGIARSLLRGGLEVIGCDVSSASRQAFEEAGGEAVASARELAPRCDAESVHRRARRIQPLATWAIPTCVAAE